MNNDEIIKHFSDADYNCFGPSGNSGVYGIYLSHSPFKTTNKTKPRLVYIGSSKNISKRILSTNHPYRLMIDRFKNLTVSTKDFETKDFINIEKFLIQHFKPILNKQYK
jgi:hypothetical protein